MSELKKQSLVPYESLEQYDAMAVMMSNASVPGLTCPEDATKEECFTHPPATLTKAAYELLRSEPYGWEGVIVTDTLSGGSVIYDGRTLPQASRQAVAAGADLIEIQPVPPPGASENWYPSTQDNRRTLAAAIAKIRNWVGDDPDRREQITESAVRVVEAKLAYLPGTS